MLRCHLCEGGITYRSVEQCFSFIADTSTEGLRTAPSHCVELLQRSILQWAYRVLCGSSGRSRHLSLAQVETAFPLLLAWNVEERKQLMELACRSFGGEHVLWFEDALVLSKQLRGAAVPLAGEQECASLRSVELAVTNTLLFTSARLREALHSVAVMLSRLSTQDVFQSYSLSLVVSVAIQVLLPFIRTKLSRTAQRAALGVVFSIVQNSVGLEAFGFLKPSSAARKATWDLGSAEALSTEVVRCTTHRKALLHPVRPSAHHSAGASVFFSVLPPTEEGSDVLMIAYDTLQCSTVSSHDLPPSSSPQWQALELNGSPVLNALIDGVEVWPPIAGKGRTTSGVFGGLDLFVGSKTLPSDEDLDAAAAVAVHRAAQKRKRDDLEVDIRSP